MLFLGLLFVSFAARSREINPTSERGGGDYCALLFFLYKGLIHWMLFLLCVVVVVVRLCMLIIIEDNMVVVRSKLTAAQELADDFVDAATHARGCVNYYNGISCFANAVMQGLHFLPGYSSTLLQHEAHTPLLRPFIGALRALSLHNNATRSGGEVSLEFLLHAVGSVATKRQADERRRKRAGGVTPPLPAGSSEADKDARAESIPCASEPSSFRLIIVWCEACMLLPASQ